MTEGLLYAVSIVYFIRFKLDVAFKKNFNYFTTYRMYRFKARITDFFWTEGVNILLYLDTYKMDVQKNQSDL